MRKLFAACIAPLIAVLTISVAADEVAKKTTPADHPEKMKAGTELFRKSVRAILTTRCLSCHGGDSLEGEFNLASRELLLQGGETGPAVVPGKSAESRLHQLITHAKQPHMPYDEEKLPEPQIQAIAKWIDLGAPYYKPLVEGKVDLKDWTEREVPDSAREFWAFQPLKAVKPGPVSNEDWERSPIDRFVLTQLEANKIAPGNDADRRTLIRRVHFGLIGLPPTPEQLQRYSNDQSPTWYATMVDELLNSPHFGERQARWWLDVARFAESHGFEQDYNRDHAYHFRDFVIKAFNADMPFDQFVRWQLAGDEIAPDNPLALMATGFLGAGVFPTQLTEKEFEPARYDELDDMVATMGTAMLGMTIGCARCHDHKFDPIPAADYYRLISTFGMTIRSHMEVELDPSATKKATEAWTAEHAPLVQELATYEKEQLPRNFEAWMKNGAPESTGGPGWVVLHVSKAESAGGATLTIQPDESILATGKNPDFDTYTFTADTSLKNIRSLRLEALSHKSMVRGGPGRASNGNMGVGQITVTAQSISGGADPLEMKLTKPRATFEQNKANLAIAGSIDGQPKTGWAVDPQFGKDHAAAFEFEKPIAGFDGGTRLTVKMVFDVNNKHNIGRARLSISDEGSSLPLNASEKPQALTELLALIKSGAKITDPKQRQEFLTAYRSLDAGWRKLAAKVADHEAKKPKPKLSTIMVSTEGMKPLKHNADGRGFPHFYKETFFLKRGDATQKVRTAAPGFLQVLTASDSERWARSPDSDARTSLQRKSLANWMTDAEKGAGHLLARVIVNRLWKHHFGRGIVSTANDFGKQGELPTHPELLDLLALQLIAHNWQLKPIHKLILSSSAYRQSAEFRPAAAKADPNNKLLWRFQPRRLQAEEIRDAMLAVSGQLDRTQFGKGTLDEGQKRRSIYFMIKRSKLIPMMQIFDAPEPLVSVGNRPSTTIASQALMFMNSPHVRGYAMGLAERSTVGSLAESVNRIYQTVVSRSATDSELAAAAEFIEGQSNSYQSEGKSNTDANRLALTDLAQTVLSLNEFVFLE